MNNQPSGRRAFFGPGTIAMVVGLIAFGAYRLLTQPVPVQRSTFEADAQGRLQRVDRPATASNSPVLHKPEPADLLGRAGLGLNAAQRVRIEAISRNWAEHEQDLKARMVRATAFLRASGQDRRSLAVLQSDMGGYAELSREYATRRERAWQEAMNVLLPKQRAKLSEVLP